MRHTAIIPLQDLAFWKKQLLYWVAGYELGVYLDSHERIPGGWECLAAADAGAVLEAPAGTAFEQLVSFQQEHQDRWLFGFLGYDLKNEIEALNSQHPDGIGLPDLGFFRPKTVVSIKPYETLPGGSVTYQLEIQTDAIFPAAVLTAIRAAGPASEASAPEPFQLKARIPKSEYLETVEALRRHIAGGDMYVMNFCQEFFAENRKLDPLAVFERLNSIGKAPFSTFLRWRDRYLLSASPERFLSKKGQNLVSQPIKGTRRRGKSPEEDAWIRADLASSEKDRSENVMIVDLVRNDFSHHCLPGSVQVEELCGIYTFETVHQMISTVSGQLSPEEHPIYALRDCFPMGSMTGAPKVMSMELIERYERSRRGLYSGAVGYFAPDGNFDFNVVIRSILYNQITGYVSAQVGGAIVYDSVPEQEYEECMVKVSAMLRALGAELE